MRQRNRRVLSAAVAAVALYVGGATAALAQETNEELKAEVKALRERLNQVEARQNASGNANANANADATPAAAQVERTVTKTETIVVDDTEPGKILAGYEDGKFFLRSADDKFSLSPGAQLQIRYTVNSRDEDDTGDDLQDGFEMRRAKFNFGGHLLTEDFTYNLQWESNENGGGVTLEEAWVRYKLHGEFDKFAVRLGQMKDNAFREETI